MSHIYNKLLVIAQNAAGINDRNEQLSSLSEYYDSGFHEVNELFSEMLVGMDDNEAFDLNSEETRRKIANAMILVNDYQLFASLLESCINHKKQSENKQLHQSDISTYSH